MRERKYDNFVDEVDNELSKRNNCDTTCFANGKRCKYLKDNDGYVMDIDGKSHFTFSYKCIKHDDIYWDF